MTLCEGLLEVLQLEGFQAIGIESGDAAYVAARRLRPDLIICDYALPGRSGNDVVRELRADPEMASIPIVIVTGYSDHSIRKKIIESGADAYLLKPFSMADLLRVVASYLPH